MADYPEILFDKALLQRVGDIGKVLGEFLDNQTQQVERTLRNKFPGIPANTVDRILNTFATLEGTKLPIHQEQINVSDISEKVVNYTLNELVSARILRFEDETYELAHDTLAARIAERRSAEDIALLEVTKLIKDRYEAFDNTHTYLNAKELQLIDNYEIKLIENNKLSKEELDFLRISKQEVRNRKITRIVYIAATMLALAITAAFGWYSWNLAKNQNEILEAQKKDLSNQRDTIKYKSERLADLILDLDSALTNVNEQKKAAQIARSEAEQERRRAEKNYQLAEQRAANLRASKDSISQLVRELELRRDSLEKNKLALEKNEQELKKKYDELEKINEELIRQENIAISNRLKAEALLTLQRGDPTEAFKTAEYAWEQGDSLPIFPTFFNIYYNDFFSYQGVNLSTPFYRNLDYTTENLKEVALAPNETEYIFIQDKTNEAILKNRLYSDIRVSFPHDGPLTGAAFSPNGKYVATTSEDKSVKVWQWNNNGSLLIEEFNDYQLEVNDVAFFHNSPLLLIGSTDKNKNLEIRKYDDLKALLTPGVKKIKSNTGIKKVAVAPNDQHIAAISAREIFILKTKGDLFFRPTKKIKVREDKTLLVDVFFSEDGEKLYLFTRKSLFIYQLKRMKEIRQLTFSQEIESVSRVLNDQYFAVGFSNNPELTLFEIEPSGLQKVISLKGHSDQVRSVGISNDGNFVISASNDRKIHWWEIKGKPITRYPPNYEFGFEKVASPFTAQYRKDSVVIYAPNGSKSWGFERPGKPGITIAPNGSHVVVFEKTGTALSLWSIDSTGQVNTPIFLKGHNKTINTVGFTPDGNFFVTGAEDGTARIWDLEGNQIHVFRPGGNLKETWFAKSGAYLVTVLNNDVKYLWKVEAKALIEDAKQIGIPDLPAQQKRGYDLMDQKKGK